MTELEIRNKILNCENEIFRLTCEIKKCEDFEIELQKDKTKLQSLLEETQTFHDRKVKEFSSTFSESYDEQCLQSCKDGLINQVSSDSYYRALGSIESAIELMNKDLLSNSDKLLDLESQRTGKKIEKQRFEVLLSQLLVSSLNGTVNISNSDSHELFLKK